MVIHDTEYPYRYEVSLNPQVDTPPFAATVTAAAPIQLYQVDPVHQSWGLNTKLKAQTHMTLYKIAPVLASVNGLADRTELDVARS